MTVNVDVDNTVNNFLEMFLLLFNSISGRNINYEDVTDYSLSKITGVPNKTLETLFFKNNSFYKTLQPLQGSAYVLEELVRNGHDVRFVTSIDYDVVQSRISFLNKHFPFINLNKSLFITSDKCSVPSDIVIDDNPEHLVPVDPTCTYIKFRQPWNKDIKDGVITCNDWYDVYSYLNQIGILRKL